VRASGRRIIWMLFVAAIVAIMSICILEWHAEGRSAQVVIETNVHIVGLVICGFCMCMCY